MECLLGLQRLLSHLSFQVSQNIKRSLQTYHFGSLTILTEAPNHKGHWMLEMELNRRNSEHVTWEGCPQNNLSTWEVRPEPLRPSPLSQVPYFNTHSTTSMLGILFQWALADYLHFSPFPPLLTSLFNWQDEIFPSKAHLYIPWDIEHSFTTEWFSTWKTVMWVIGISIFCTTGSPPSLATLAMPVKSPCSNSPHPMKAFQHPQLPFPISKLISLSV